MIVGLRQVRQVAAFVTGAPVLVSGRYRKFLAGSVSSGCVTIGESRQIIRVKLHSSIPPYLEERKKYASQDISFFTKGKKSETTTPSSNPAGLSIFFLVQSRNL